MNNILKIFMFLCITFFGVQADENLILAFDVSASHFGCKEALTSNYRKALELLSPQNLESNGFNRVVILTYASDINMTEVDLHCDNCNKRFYKQKSAELVKILYKQVEKGLNMIKMSNPNDLRTKRDIWAVIRYVSKLAANRYLSDKNYVYIIGGILQEIRSKKKKLINFYTGENVIHIPDSIKSFEIFGKGEELCKYPSLTVKDFGYKELRRQILSIVDNNRKLKIYFNY